MTQRAQIVDITKSYLPIDPNAFPQNLVNTDREDGEEKVFPLLPYEGYNFLPTSYGYRSYFGTNSRLDIGSLAARPQFIFAYQLPNYQTRFIALCENGIWVCNTGVAASNWTQAVVFNLNSPAPFYQTTVYEEWTWCMIENVLYMYQQGRANAWKTAIVANELAIQTHTPTFLNMAGQMGIFKAGTRLGFWDSANSVSWSSNVDLTDFTPSIENLAGNTIFGSITGRIVTIRGHGEGFVIYATKSILGVNFTQEGNLLWAAKDILSDTGIGYSRAVTTAQSNSEHFAWTTSGIVKIGKYTAITGKHEVEWILPELYDLLRESREQVYLECLQERFLCFATVSDVYLSRAPGFVEVAVDTIEAPPLVIDNTFFTVNDGGLFDGDEAYQVIYNFLNNPTGALTPYHETEPYQLARWMFAFNALRTTEDQTLAAVGAAYPNRPEFEKCSDLYADGTTTEATHAILRQVHFFPSATPPTGMYTFSNYLVSDEEHYFFGQATLGVYAKPSFNLTPYTNTSGPRSALDLLQAWIAYVRQFLYEEDQVLQIARDLVGTSQAIDMYSTNASPAAFETVYCPISSQALDTIYNIDRAGTTLTIGIVSNSDKRGLLLCHRTGLVVTDVSDSWSASNMGCYIYIPNGLNSYAGNALRLVWGGVTTTTITTNGIKTAADLRAFFLAHPIIEDVTGYQWFIDEDPLTGWTYPGTDQAPTGGSYNTNIILACPQRGVSNYILKCSITYGYPDGSSNLGYYDWKAVSEIDYAALTAIPENANLINLTVPSQDRRSYVLAVLEQHWLDYISYLHNAASSWTAYLGHYVTPILGQVSFEYEGDYMFVVNGANGRVAVYTYPKIYRHQYTATYEYSEALIATAPRTFLQPAIFQLEAVDTVVNVSSTEINIISTSQIRPSVLSGVNYDLPSNSSFIWDGPMRTYAARDTECSRVHIYDLASSTSGIHAADFIDINAGTMNSVDMITAPRPLLPATLICPMDSLGTGAFTVTSPVDIVLPGATFLLQTGSIEPGYVTYTGAFVFDLQLKKWGKFVRNFKQLIEFNAINTDQITVTYSDLGINGGVIDASGYVYAFDAAPVRSYIRYGKYGSYRLGLTNLLELRIHQRRPVDFQLEVESSLDGNSVDLPVYQSPLYVGEIEIVAYMDIAARWHTVKISGNFDLTGLEFRGILAGRR